jgi:hypothetical protein
MSKEITVQSNLLIRKGNLNYRSPVSTFQADMDGTPKGPTPGVLSVPTTGVDVSLAQLTTPGWCQFTNLGRADGGDDTQAYVQVGVHDGALFHPLLELLPGESYPVRLARVIGEEEQATGTGTSAAINSLRLHAVGSVCNVVVEAFEK